MAESKAPWHVRLEAWSKSPPATPLPRISLPSFDGALAWAAGQPTMYAGIRLKGDRIDYHGQYQPVAGVRVTVESVGELQRRSTLTRTVAGGLVFGPAGAIVGALFRKKVDRRELYVMVDGPLFAWAVKVNPGDSAAAHSFAAKVNTEARR